MGPAALILLFQFSEAKFSSSGREDVDVRMLGQGRPFMFEITNPRTSICDEQVLKNIESGINEFNKDIFVTHLCQVPK